MEPSVAFNASEESPPLPFPNRETGYSWNRRHDRDHFAERSHNEGSSSTTADDSRSCFLVATTFSFFVALTLSFGLYGTETMHLGPNSSILIKPNHLLVESIMVEEVDVVQGPIVYGFYKDPPLDVEVAWSETHEIIIPGNFHKEWMYYLNEGSQINISYSLKSSSGSSLVLVIAQGEGDLNEWLTDPSYPTTSLSRKIINGNGSIQKQVAISSYYYIAVGNLGSEFAEVYLNTRIKAVTYNTAESYYKCTPAQGQCRFQLQLLSENVAVITSPGGKSGIVGGGWLVRVSYGPRWLTYLVGIGIMTSLVLFINSLFNHFRRTERATSADEFIATGSERNPLLSRKDDRLSSGESSHVSLSEDGERGEGTHDEDDEHIQRLCAICFDSPKDSFFLPCGHSMACFTCAKRILEASGTCPMCRRRAKKVRKIYTA